MFYLNKPQIPSIQYQTMKKLFIEEGLEEQFLAFQHCSHNHFLRETLYQRQHGLCPYCGKPVIGTKINTRVHHNPMLTIVNILVPKSKYIVLKVMAVSQRKAPIVNYVTISILNLLKPV